MDSSLRIDLDTALGGPKGAEPGPDHGRAAGGFTLPGGLLRALSACPAGRNGRPTGRQIRQT